MITVYVILCACTLLNILWSRPIKQYKMVRITIEKEIKLDVIP